MQIRTLTVELLRAGTRHNQLLSPLTPYLGIFENSPAGIVKVPFEHRQMELRLQDLRYTVSAQDPERRQQMLDDMGQDIANILIQVPGVSNLLALEREQADTITQLRVVISASELAMLPFELSKVLAGSGAPGVWLALQGRAPVCITRHIRSVSAEGMPWPIAPRILFIAGPETPVDDHRHALLRTLEPWGNTGPTLVDRLVCLEGEQATLGNLEAQMRQASEEKKPFTHVHLLAHGTKLDENDRYSAIGVALFDKVVRGTQLAQALMSVSDRGTARPVVVTLAACNSDVQDNVLAPDASVAHDLHDQGIPLVVASQFPLSIPGSTPFVQWFYEGQLRGEHPVQTMFEVRRRLFQSQDVHDWASLVVYEALPSDFDDQLEHLRYWQARRAHEHALDRLEKGVDVTQYDALTMRATARGDRLPTTGPYALECAGLRAAGHKRIAQVAFDLAIAPGTTDDRRKGLFGECLDRLEQSHREYWRATRAFLADSSEPMRRKANLHWLLGQVLCLNAVLGRTLDPHAWSAAHFAAQMDTEHGNEEVRAWAHISLAELALLQLSDESLSADTLAQYADETVRHAARVVDMLGRSSEHAKTTYRQFERYVTWWGNADLGWAFEQLGLPTRQHWRREGGLVATAARVVAMLGTPQLSAGA